MNEEIYTQNPKFCKFCNEKILYKKRRNKFCNHSCAAAFNNKGVRRHGIPPGNCKYCNTILKSYKRTWCSHVCVHKYNWEQWCSEIEETGGFPGYHVNSHSPRAKKYLAEKRGHQCEICKNTEWMGVPIPLILDHINGKPDNWKLNNVRLVCGNCDMQLPTYKSKNKGNTTRKFNVKVI